MPSPEVHGRGLAQHDGGKGFFNFSPIRGHCFSADAQEGDAEEGVMQAVMCSLLVKC